MPWLFQQYSVGPLRKNAGRERRVYWAEGWILIRLTSCAGPQDQEAAEIPIPLDLSECTGQVDCAEGINPLERPIISRDQYPLAEGGTGDDIWVVVTGGHDGAITARARGWPR